MKKQLLLIGLVVVAILCVSVASMADSQTLDMVIGQQQILDGSNIKRIAIGDESVANVRISEDQSEVIVTAISPGTTALSLWTKDGKQQTMLINVFKTDPKTIVGQVKQMLGDMEGPVVKMVGNRVVIDGVTLTEADKTRLEKVVGVFDGTVVNLTTHTPMILPTENIIMDFYVVEVNKGHTKDFGINWDDALNAATGLLIDTAITGSLGGAGLATSGPGTLTTVANFGASLRMSELNNNAKTHDHHTIVTQSGTAAEYLAGGELLIKLVGEGTSALEKVNLGTYITATPIIDPSGLMKLDLNVEVSMVAGTDADGNITLNKRKIKNTVNLKKGETLALAGLIQNFDTKAADAVPGLGKIPVLGFLFKSEKYQTGETEAVIFITPNVVTPDSQESSDMIGGVLSEYEKPLE